MRFLFQNRHDLFEALDISRLDAMDNGAFQCG
jgi:hypothetical protein